MACAEKNHFKCFDFLIERGADIFATRDDGADATYIAARYNHQEIIDSIVQMEQVHLIINRPTFRGRTAFLTSAFNGHLVVCKKILRLTENINHQDDDGLTALNYAAKEGHLEVVEWLAQRVANPDIKNKDGAKALNYALRNQHKEVAQFLRQCHIQMFGGKKPDNGKLIQQNTSGRRGSVPNVQKKGQRRRSLYPGMKLC